MLNLKHMGDNDTEISMMTSDMQHKYPNLKESQARRNFTYLEHTPNAFSVWNNGPHL